MSALMEEVARARDELKASFLDGHMASVVARQKRVAAVAAMLADHLDEASAALTADMGRPKGEADGECFLAIREARDIGSRIASWAKPESHSVHAMMQPADAAVRRSPFGAVLVIAPYNYPLLLAIEPLLGAISAGNTVMLKPSELTPATAAFMSRYLPEYLPTDICRVMTGGVDVSKALLATQWDFIYFTGSPRVGRIVAKAAAEYMTPTALELGGKAPAVVHESAAIREAARRLINTKAINVGQTCMAPDYVLVHTERHDELLEALEAEICAQFGSRPATSPDFGRMCTVDHFDRMTKLLATGGGTQRGVGDAPPDRAAKYMPLTLVDNPPFDSPLLKEEIFGPILPILQFSSLEDATAIIRRIDPTPLALYVFAQSESVSEELLSRVQSGIVCVNDCVVQHLCHSLPFGGVGTSGHGVCHGRWSYETFTYPRAVLWRHGKFDIDQTVPLPLRHASPLASPTVRPLLLKYMLLYGPYLVLPRTRHLALSFAAAILAYAFGSPRMQQLAVFAFLAAMPFAFGLRLSSIRA